MRAESRSKMPKNPPRLSDSEQDEDKFELWIPKSWGHIMLELIKAHLQHHKSTRNVPFESALARMKRAIKTEMTLGDD